MESHVCLRRTGVTGCDIWRITAWAWNSDDSRRKCHVALLGLFAAPPGGVGVHPKGLLTPTCLVSFPNISSDVDSCYLVWVPRDSRSIFRGFNSCFRKIKDDSELSVFCPCGSADPSWDAGGMVSSTRARHPNLQSVLSSANLCAAWNPASKMHWYISFCFHLQSLQMPASCALKTW